MPNDVANAILALSAIAGVGMGVMLGAAFGVATGVGAALVTFPIFMVVFARCGRS